MTSNSNDDAVSPVIGILLMLVVTIIIAAVVSGFAGGLSGGQEKAPNVAIAATKVVTAEVYDADLTDGYKSTVPTGKSPNAYVLFENQGGEGMQVDDVQFRVSSLKYPADKALIDNSVTPNSSTTVRGNKANIKDPNVKGWSKYIETYPDRTQSVISPGSKFVLHFDFGKYVPAANYKSLDFRADGATTSMSVTEGDYLVYDLIDKKSKKIVSSGKIQIPPFTVLQT